MGNLLYEALSVEKAATPASLKQPPRNLVDGRAARQRPSSSPKAFDDDRPGAPLTRVSLCAIHIEPLYVAIPGWHSPPLLLYSRSREAVAHLSAVSFD